MPIQRVACSFLGYANPDRNCSTWCQTVPQSAGTSRHFSNGICQFASLCSCLSFDDCQAESLPWIWKSGSGAPPLDSFSPYAYSIILWTISCCVHRTEMQRYCSDPLLLALWVHCFINTEVTWPPGCSPSRMEHSKVKNKFRFISITPGLLWWVTWAQGLPSDWPNLSWNCPAVWDSLSPPHLQDRCQTCDALLSPPSLLPSFCSLWIFPPRNLFHIWSCLGVCFLESQN